MFFLLYSVVVSGQKEFNVACIAFYNVENLFDTIDSPDTDDVEFTPKGVNLYNSFVYYDKLGKLSRVISEIGSEYTVDGAAILGLAEIENRTVLEDLILQPALKNRGYQILHHDSRDARGVDVALLYQPKYFIPDTAIYIPVRRSEEGEKESYARDILVAVGSLNGEKVGITVNHWPSRRGGEKSSAHLRNYAALLNRDALDSLFTKHGIDATIVMGDLNDDPVNDSLRKILKSGSNNESISHDEMYNPMEEFFRKGLGTNAYRDAWSLFDQIILGPGFINDKAGYHYYKAGVHNPSYMTQKSGDFKGYPMRTYANGLYVGGYSDHFPVYVLLVKEKS